MDHIARATLTIKAGLRHFKGTETTSHVGLMADGEAR